jgi:uncharacterized protein YndB with AHSA1/START domain
MTDGVGALEMRRVLPARRPVVFAAFRDTARLAQWWGPEGFTVPAIDFSTLTGEAYRIEMQPPEGDPFSVHGVFRTVHPPTRLSFTFMWDPPDPDDVETLVDLSFEDHGDRTEVALWQGDFRTEARLELHRDGWTESFDKLERLLAQPSERRM